MAKRGPLSTLDVSKGPPGARRLFHAAVGTSIPVVALFLSEPLPVFVTGIMAAGSLALDLIRLRTPWLNRLFLRWLRLLLKTEEESRITGATYLLIAAFIAFLAFDKEIAVTVLLFLSLGDPAAALIGGPIPGPRIFGKSPVGTVAFVGASLLVIGLLTTTGVLEFHWTLVAAAVVGGLVELAPLPFDDNLTVPLISGGWAQYAPLLLEMMGLA